ncbi:MAG: glycosyltransferase, partial [Verrucomicrobiota bacterium]
IWLGQALYGPAKAAIGLWLLRRQRRLYAQGVDRRAPVALIISAKGAGDLFPRFLELVSRQDYPSYRLLFVTESANDPARLAMKEFLKLPDGEDHWTRPDKGSGLQEVDLLVAGFAEVTGQKVFNQLAAFEKLRDEDEIIAFADSDILGGEDWLEQLAMPLNRGDGELSTGYRWFVPETDSLANIVATNINSAIATMNGPSWHTLLWGGSMAIHRSCFEDMDVPRLLRGSLNDDLQISAEARRRRKRIRFVRSLFAPSPVNYSWGSLLEFARRQYFQVWTYVPHFWFTAAFFTTSWVVACVWNWVALINGNWWSAGVIGTVFLLNLIRSALRKPHLRALFPEETRMRLRAARRWEWATDWLNHSFHCVAVFSPLFLKELTWAGIRYRVRGRQEVKVLERDGFLESS